LFSTITEEIIKKVKMQKGYKKEQEKIKTLCYADDVALLAANEDNLQRLREFSMTVKKINMKESPQTTNSGYFQRTRQM
jgi:PP-loop superfamily ATP-utilizing enzyme